MKRIRAGVILIIAALSLPAFAEPTASDTARAWLRSLRAEKPVAIVTATSLPFAYREAWKKKSCERSVDNQKELEAWFGCIHKQERLLLDQLEFEKDILTFESGQGSSPRKLRALTKGLGNGDWVHGWLSGDGVSYEFLILVNSGSGKPQVSACLVDATFDGG